MPIAQNMLSKLKLLVVISDGCCLLYYLIYYNQVPLYYLIN